MKYRKKVVKIAVKEGSKYKPSHKKRESLRNEWVLLQLCHYINEWQVFRSIEVSTQFLKITMLLRFIKMHLWIWATVEKEIFPEEELVSWVHYSTIGWRCVTHEDWNESTLKPRSSWAISQTIRWKCSFPWCCSTNLCLKQASQSKQVESTNNPTAHRKLLRLTEIFTSYSER